MQPNEKHLRILRNCSSGRSFEEGFVHQQEAVQTMWQCLLQGWVSRNKITPEGAKVLAQYDRTPLKGNFEVTVVKPEKAALMLPPSSLFNPELRGKG